MSYKTEKRITTMKLYKQYYIFNIMAKESVTNIKWYFYAVDIFDPLALKVITERSILSYSDSQGECFSISFDL